MSRFEIEHDSSDGNWWVRGDGIDIVCATEESAKLALDRLDALDERIAHLERELESVRAHVRSRIEVCRAQESKFAGAWTKPGRGPPQSLVEAWTERQALESVLVLLSESPDRPTAS